MDNLSMTIHCNGCKKKIEYPHTSKELDELSAFICEDYLLGDIYVQPLNKKRALRLGRNFMGSHFKMHEIWQVDHKKLNEILGDGPITVGDLLKAEKECERYIHPFDLKVVFTNNKEIFDGELTAKTYTKEFKDIARAQPSFLKISLSSRVTLATPLVYVHELTHSQLQSNLGSVRYYKNIELLPYFLELLCSYAITEDEFTLKIMEQFLANEIVRYNCELKAHEAGTLKMSKEQLVETGKYLSSTISALNFFILYYKGSPTTKKYILEEIQKVFNGMQDLEELSKRMGVNDQINNMVLQKHLTR